MHEIQQAPDGCRIALLSIEEFTLEHSTRFILELTEVKHSSADEIHVLINSDGGDTRAMYGILDAINNYDGQINVCGVGSCGSSAAFLLFSAYKQMRYAAPNTEFLLHGCSISMAGQSDFRQPEFAKLTKFAGWRKQKRLEKRLKQETDNKLIDLVSEASGLTPQFLFEQIKENDGEWVLSAEQALELDLVDYIGIPFLDGDGSVS